MSMFNIIHEPKVELTLNAKDVDILMKCAGSHYDRTCRALASPGGMLYGWFNAVSFDGEQHTQSVTAKELDILLKTAEMVDLFDGIYLYAELRQAYTALKDTYDKLSKVTP